MPTTNVPGQYNDLAELESTNVDGLRSHEIRPTTMPCREAWCGAVVTVEH